ncbi:hypothetical protein TNIN_350791 [Trichonephila inaurata madagascariensis]|uniref:Uncharacterized protein n=1 Tax=Trichonephila inaurata madagascariensis TaxID=2747483 RepID=A0A8X6MFJ4_9ARAC|nr:hypothetical protein TNIN_350791 [Trichonephila inaurata madagascariensis]
MASAITVIDKILIRKPKLVIRDRRKEKFKEFCLATAKLYVALYPWYYKPQSLHKVLIHEGLVNSSILPLGQMLEEAIEAWDKDSK